GNVAHLRQRLHPRDAVAAVNPVVVPFHCDAGDTGVLQRLQGFDGAGKRAWKNLSGMEQVAGDQDEIHPFCDGVGHDAPEHAEEVFVTFGFTGRGAVGFAEVDVGGVDEANSFRHALYDSFENSYTLLISRFRKLPLDEASNKAVYFSSGTP